MKIAIDVMGGDYAPKEIVEGVEQARDINSDVIYQLFGDRNKINKYLKNNDSIEIHHTEEYISMDDEPTKAIKKKKNSSLVLAAKSVKEGNSDSLFSAGNTGAIMVAGLLIVGRIKGIDRPGLTTTLPVIDNDMGFTMIDCGANADTKLLNIKQYALMGKYYAENVKKIDNPRIGLINNGTESDKGNIQHREMYEMLSEMNSINFIGNIESRDLLNGVTDVAVTDGFTGNAVLKTIEGTALSMMNLIKKEIKSNGMKSKIGALLLKNSFKDVGRKMDYTRYGGALLLGLKAPVVKSHGNSKAKTVKNSLVEIQNIVDSGLTNSINDYFDNDQNKTEK